MSQNTALPSKDRKTDRRVQRTRQALSKALIELIEEKGYDAISVEEITQRANVGRATFYLHYKSKEDILLEAFSEKISEQARLNSEISIDLFNPGGQLEDDESVARPLELVFEHAAANANFYRVLLRSEVTRRILGQLSEITVRSFSRGFKNRFLDKMSLVDQAIPSELITVYFSGALLSCVTWWLGQDPAPPPRLMAEYFRTLLIQGLEQVLVVKKPD